MCVVDRPENQKYNLISGKTDAVHFPVKLHICEDEKYLSKVLGRLGGVSVRVLAFNQGCRFKSRPRCFMLANRLTSM